MRRSMTSFFRTYTIQWCIKKPSLFDKERVQINGLILEGGSKERSLIYFAMGTYFQPLDLVF